MLPALPPWLHTPNSATPTHTVSAGRPLNASSRNEWKVAWTELDQQMQKNKKSFKQMVIPEDQQCQLSSCQMPWFPGLHPCSACNAIIHKSCACSGEWWDLKDLGCLYCSAACHAADEERRLALVMPFHEAITTEFYAFHLPHHGQSDMVA